MELALTDLFRAKWSHMIHDEWIKAVLKNSPDLSIEKLKRTRDLMDANVRDCVVENFEDLIPSLQLPDPNDRHVLAAAIRGRADLIVIYNLADFPDTPLKNYGVAAQHPDEFLKHLIDLAPGNVCAAAKTHRKRLGNPGKTVDQYLEILEKQQLNEFVSSLRPFGNVL